MSATVLRYPCACEVKSADDSCAHVDDAVAKILGKKILRLNSVADMERDEKKKRESKGEPT